MTTATLTTRVNPTASRAGAAAFNQGEMMSIDNLTFGELKQIAAMFSGQQAAHMGVQ